MVKNGFSGPAPGCPEKSVKKRRWVNHNACGSSVDPENPEYYTNQFIDYSEDYTVYETSVWRGDYDYAYSPHATYDYDYCLGYMTTESPFDAGVLFQKLL